MQKYEGKNEEGPPINGEQEQTLLSWIRRPLRAAFRCIREDRESGLTEENVDTVLAVLA